VIVFDSRRQSVPRPTEGCGLLGTEDYFEIGHMVRKAARRIGGGYFAILEGGYNHQVLGANALALINGMSEQ